MAEQERTADGVRIIAEKTLDYMRWNHVYSNMAKVGAIAGGLVGLVLPCFNRELDLNDSITAMGVVSSPLALSLAGGIIAYQVCDGLDYLLSKIALGHKHNE